MKKILITGSSGYIGSHLSKILKDKYEVHGLDINDSILPVERFYKININNLSTYLSTIYDTVIHLAALVNVNESSRQPVMYYNTNLNGTLNVLKYIRTNNFIFASTGAAVQCKSAYGVSKRAAEDCVVEFYNKRLIKNHTVFRFYNVIGSDGFKPTNPDGLMYNLMTAKERDSFTIYGTDYNTVDGTCVRDYVHVNEICNALMLAIEQPSNGLENLGHGVGYTVKQIVDKYKEINNVDFSVNYGSRRGGDVESSVLDNVSSYMKKMYNIDQLLKVTT